MATKISNIFNSKFGRAVRVLALVEVVAFIFNTSIDLPTGFLISDAHAQQVPEMPVIMLPMFVAAIAGAVGL